MTIKEQIEKALLYDGTKLLTFEATHDEFMCSHVDFFYPENDSFAIGFTLLGKDRTISALQQTILEEFKDKFGGECYIIHYDGETILNPEAIKLAHKEIMTVRKEARNLELLKYLGLNEADSIVFYDLLRELKPPKTDVDAFYKEMEEGVPFEGGMGLGEALVGATLSL